MSNRNSLPRPPGRLVYRCISLVFPTLALVSTALAACGSDGPAGPAGSALTTQQAYTIFAARAADPNAPNSDMAMVGEIVAAMGAPVVELPVIVSGVSEPFHALALQMRADTSGVPLDSLIVVVGWRGDNATEMFVASAVSDTTGSRRAGYPIGEVMYAKDSTVLGDYTADDGSVALHAAPAAGNCTPAAVGGDLLMAALQASRVSCGGATFTGGFSGPLMTYAGAMPITLSLGGIAGSAVKLHAQQGIAFQRVPTRRFPYIDHP